MECGSRRLAQSRPPLRRDSRPPLGRDRRPPVGRDRRRPSALTCILMRDRGIASPAAQRVVLALGYDARRFEGAKQADDFVKVTFPPASAIMPRVDYTLDVTAIYPGPRELANDPRFNGFRRNWLNIFQLSPRHRALANNAN